MALQRASNDVMTDFLQWSRQDDDEERGTRGEFGISGSSSDLSNSTGSLSSMSLVPLPTTEEDYQYDYDESTADLPLVELLSVSFVYGLTFVLGAIGNSLVIICIARFRRMHNVTNIFLVSLASADLMLVCLCIPIKFAKWFTFTWKFGEFLCKSVHYMQNTSVICSVLTLTTMSLERYYAILEPMQARYTCTSSRAKKLVLFLWIASFILASPIIYGQVLKEVGEKRIGYWCIKEWDNAVQERIYEMGMLFLILVFPLTAMTFAYASICLELWTVLSSRHSIRARSHFQRPPVHPVDQDQSTGTSIGANHSRQSTNPPHVDDNKTRKQVIKMLVAIVILFALCWTPTLVDSVLVAFGLLDRLHYGQLKHARQAFALMSYANSCVNPIVYAFMSKNFRTGFKHTLCAVCSRRGRLDSRAHTLRRARQTSFQTPAISMVYTRSAASGFHSGGAPGAQGGQSSGSYCNSRAKSRYGGKDGYDAHGTAETLISPVSEE